MHIPRMLWSEVCSVVAQVFLAVRSGLGMCRMLDLDFAEHLFDDVTGVRTAKILHRELCHQ